jgi:hypothetical protein
LTTTLQRSPWWQALPPLVELVRSGSFKGRVQAAGVLLNLTFNVANKAAFVEAGALPLLV